MDNKILMIVNKNIEMYQLGSVISDCNYNYVKLHLIGGDYGLSDFMLIAKDIGNFYISKTISEDIDCSAIFDINIIKLEGNIRDLLEKNYYPIVNYKKEMFWDIESKYLIKLNGETSVDITCRDFELIKL